MLRSEDLWSLFTVAQKAKDFAEECSIVSYDTIHWTLAIAAVASSSDQTAVGNFIVAQNTLVKQATDKHLSHHLILRQFSFETDGYGI
jgi:hypothetical protein